MVWINSQKNVASEKVIHPILIIDDEADHASVDTGEQIHHADGSLDEDYQPKAINSGIRKILNSFSNCLSFSCKSEISFLLLL